MNDFPEEQYFKEVLKTVAEIENLLENNKTHIQLTALKYQLLPTIPNYHLDLLYSARNFKELVILNRVNSWIDQNNPRDREIFQALQYHPNYPIIMQEFNACEKALVGIRGSNRSIERPCQSILSGPFISLKILETIFQKYQHCYQLQFLCLQSITVNLTIIECTKISAEKLFEYCQTVAKVIMVLIISYRIRDSSSRINLVNIHLYPTKYRKRLPRESNHLTRPVLTFLENEAKREKSRLSIDNYASTTGVAEVNSAMCTKSLDSSESYIVIWRKEDWINRLCHELIHYFKLEKVVLPPLVGPGINSNLKVNPNELVTEVQTYFLWTVYRLLTKKRNTNNRTKTKTNTYTNTNTNNRNQDYIFLQKMLREDQAHLIKMGHRFLSHYGTNLAQLYQVDQPIININSNAYYYYVLRGVIWIKFDQTLLDLLIPKGTLSAKRLVKNLCTKMKPFDVMGTVALNKQEGIDLEDRYSLKFYP